MEMPLLQEYDVEECTNTHEGGRTNHVLGQEEASEQAPISNSMCLRVLVGIVGSIVSIFLLIIGVTFMIFSVFAGDSGNEYAFVTLGGLSIHVGILTVIAGVGVFLASLQVAMNKRNLKFIWDSVEGILAHDAASIFAYCIPVCVVLAPFGSFPSIEINILTRLILSHWVGWLILECFGVNSLVLYVVQAMLTFG